MRVLHKVSLVVGLVIGFGANALAADMPSARKVASVPVPAAYNWSGLYAGVNGGYGWGKLTDDGGSVRANGFVGGGQVGANWQNGALVLGVEADFQGTSQKHTETAGPLTVSGKLPWFGTLRGRVGWTPAERWLVYVTGGGSYGKVTVEGSAFGVTVSSSDTKSGYALGAGTEWALGDRWSSKLEYLYLDTGKTTMTFFGVPFKARVTDQIVRAGLNYHF